MLAYIKGPVLAKRENYLIVQAGGLGYKIFVAPKVCAQAADPVELYLYHQVKEDGQALFGFASLAELEFFELLVSVSGIGPKSALNILASASLEQLKGAIAAGDHAPLTSVSGIGQKTAQRLVIELKSKIDFLAPADGGGSALAEELEALLGLGYSREQARQALAKVDKDTKDSSERLRQALRNL